MRYNFDEHINRYGSHSSKWDHADAIFQGKDLLPMWVADTDFRAPDEAFDAIKKRLEHPILGYTSPDDDLYQAIIDKVKRAYNWEIKKEWILFTNGVVSACHIAARTFANIGDEIIVQNPVYSPFKRLSVANGLIPIDNRLVFKDGKYQMDFEHLRILFKTGTGYGARVPRVKAAILCNPHNPVGRVWTEEELREYADICIENNCLIVSDDIWGDIVVNGNQHILLASLDKKYEENSITIIAPSKTFNIAGLKSAVVIIPNDQIRKDFSLTQAAGYNSPNLLGLEALKACYRHGDDYIEDLNNYLSKNFKYFSDYIHKHMPELKVVEPEGTYVAWVDMSGLNMTDEELMDFMINKAKIATNFGYTFGPGGEGFQRFNLGCTLDTVKEALRRLENAVKEWRKGQK